jgi:predicted DNA-binding mobile mystery protein A
MKIFEKLAVLQLDKTLDPFSALLMHQPKEGWVRTIRQTLHMSTRVLAKRLKITQSTVVDLEAREAEKGITLKKLEEVAEVLDCKLVYALVPKHSFTAMIKEQEKQKAESLVNHTQKTMSLEQQALLSDQLRTQIDLVRQHIQNEPLKNLWKTHEF